MRAEPLLITLGDANGLGPELACRLLSGPLPAHLASRVLLLLGAEASLRAHLSFAGGAPFWTRVDDPARVLAPSGESAVPGVYLYEPPGLADIRVQVGQATPDGGRAAGVALATACDLLLAAPAGASSPSG
ncbi:4-hydroxythreonine-4-phosphate dehydrogenase PdxA, partial [Desulfovibrio sp. XJ01]|nr:4-hydroxythreonine-4-phosphate dehydrogenase PdxA [Nitratidesulfovibrio liaohensis]